MTPDLIALCDKGCEVVKVWRSGDRIAWWQGGYDYDPRHLFDPQTGEYRTDRPGPLTDPRLGGWIDTGTRVEFPAEVRELVVGDEPGEPFGTVELRCYHAQDFPFTWPGDDFGQLLKGTGRYRAVTRLRLAIPSRGGQTVTYVEES